MLEKPYDADPEKEDGIPADREEGNSSEMDSDGAVRPAQPEKQYRPKKKVPIINRRGPSEVDKAIKISRMNSVKSQQAGRKLSEGSNGYGTIIRIDRAKGFGFLIDQMGEQRFFHRSAVLNNGFSALTEQQAVEFQAHNDERGARALKVRPSKAPDRPTKNVSRTPQTAKSDKAPTWRSALSPFRNGTTTPSYSGISKPRNRNRNG